MIYENKVVINYKLVRKMILLGMFFFGIVLKVGKIGSILWIYWSG